MTPKLKVVSSTTPTKEETSVLLQKLEDAETPGFTAEFDPDEAEEAGAFAEEALTEEDAAESSNDFLDIELP